MTPPKIGTILSNEDGDEAYVVSPDTPVIDALLDFIEEGFGSPRFSPDNPAIVKAMESGLKIEPWHACSPEFIEAQGWDDESYTGWWAPDGDLAETIYVLNYDRSIYLLGEEAEAAQATEVDAG